MGSVRKPATAGLTAWLIGLLALACGQGLARDGRSTPREILRAKPPAAVWDKPTARTFHNDAFAELDGDRPDFAAAGQRAPASGASQPAGAVAPAAGGPTRSRT
jgi:hypothetical protein